MTVVVEAYFVYLNEGKQQKKMHKIRKFSTDNFSLHQRERNEGNERRREREREGTKTERGDEGEERGRGGGERD